MNYLKIEELIKKISKEIIILVAEDDNFIRRIIAKILKKWNLKVIEAKDGKEAWEKFKENYKNIGIVLLDWIMPEMDGLKVCQLIRKFDMEHYVYVIFLSSIEEKEKIAECLEVGADDYIIKPIHEKEFLARIKSALRIIALERELTEANQKLEKLATFDELTGALNRRALYEELKKNAYRALREGKNLYILMVDIDHFKKVNDTYGHQIGDEVLKEVVKRFKLLLRPYDIIGRYGGEEFLIAFINEKETNAVEVAERLRKIIAKTPFQISKDICLFITISLGVSVFKPTKVNPNEKEIISQLEEAIKLADKALYEAKNQGRNKVITYF